MLLPPPHLEARSAESIGCDDAILRIRLRRADEGDAIVEEQHQRLLECEVAEPVRAYAGRNEEKNASAEQRFLVAFLRPWPDVGVWRVEPQHPPPFHATTDSGYRRPHRKSAEPWR